MNILVTGAAGFIASNLTDRLLTEGHSVRGFDNLSTGRREFLDAAGANSSFELVEGDLLDVDHLSEAMRGIDAVFHLAANADVRFGADHPRKDLEQNIICTSNVLEAMRANGVRRIAFTSTGSVYGEPGVFPTPEDVSFPVQTSLYGASKVAAEAMISAYCEAFGFQGTVFRFVSVLGERYTHGHVVDFHRQLTIHPDRLSVLGDGNQRKSYVYVDDCLSALMLALQPAEKFRILNVGTDEYCTVKDSIRWICEYLNLTPEIQFSGGERGWVGDSPFIFLDCRRLRSLGWQPKLTIRESIRRTLRDLVTRQDKLPKSQPDQRCC